LTLAASNAPPVKLLLTGTKLPKNPIDVPSLDECFGEYADDDNKAHSTRWKGIGRRESDHTTC